MSGPALSRRLGNRVLLKREDLQPVFSFKLRGAYNKIAHLSDTDALQRGVICASAGNHAQGVALGRAAAAASRPMIVMPPTTPAIKVQAVRDRGGEVVLHGDDLRRGLRSTPGELAARARAHLHPSLRRPGRDRRAGHDRHGDPAPALRAAIDAIFVADRRRRARSPASRAYVKSLLPAGAGSSASSRRTPPAMHDSLHAGAAGHARRSVGIFADGVAVRQVGEETFRLAQQVRGRGHPGLHRRDLRRHPRISSRTPAPSPSRPARWRIAGMKTLRGARAAPPARTLVAINCGANINFDRLRHVAERADIGERARGAARGGRSPSSRAASCAFCQPLGRRSVTEFNYRYADARSARIFVGVQLHRGRAREADRLHRRRCATRAYRGARHERRRDGQAARALHGGRPRARHPRTSCCTASSSPNARARC
ncbi:MAG: pyridoxal-phosphate dependent enzyme [Chromatiales bacterium]|nr:pyridoxal-phosphate dependent enzyme [Chromatiales bacterium]